MLERAPTKKSPKTFKSTYDALLDRFLSTKITQTMDKLKTEGTYFHTNHLQIELGPLYKKKTFFVYSIKITNSINIRTEDSLYESTAMPKLSSKRIK